MQLLLASTCCPTSLSALSSEPDRCDFVTTPPRTGKSRLLAVWEVVWALMRNPDLQIVLVSYSDELPQATAAMHTN